MSRSKKVNESNGLDQRVEEEHGDRHDAELDKPLPRYKRRRRRPPEDRGLPPDEDLMRLADAYATHQGKLWPELLAAGLLSKPRPELLTEMVEDFKRRHRTGQLDVALLKPLIDRKLTLAGNYDRYSSDNSDAHSIIDQMVNALEKARKEDRFIPWSYIFADYAVSGLDPGRRGFLSYKVVLAAPEHQIETTYIDDFTRASRDDIEWWKLAKLTNRLRKRLIGASDGFDLSSSYGTMLLSIFLLVSKLFIKQLREKVKRGMRGGARRKTCLGKPSLGLTRRAKRQADGSVERNPDGTLVYEWCHDPSTMDFARLLFELFVVKNWSPGKITQHFNQLCVEGWDGWSESGIRKMLRNPIYIGVNIWNRTRREYDEEKEQWVVVKNPRSEWVVTFDRNLALISLDWWRAAQRKLAESRRKNNRAPRSRNQISATTLFSGTLVCEYCGHELTLNRSAGKYKSLFCLNGPLGAHGCKLKSSKSTQIIEASLLQYLKEVLLTEDTVKELIGRANAYLANEAARPQTDTRAMKSELRKKESVIKKLFDRLGKASDEHLCSAYEQQIAQLKREADHLKGEIRNLDAKNAPPPAPLKLKDVKRYVEDLRGLLNQEIPAAAEAIRRITGPIKIRQERIPGRKMGARWIATFSPNLLPALAHLGQGRNYPDCWSLDLPKRERNNDYADGCTNGNSSNRDSRRHGTKRYFVKAPTRNGPASIHLPPPDLRKSLETASSASRHFPAKAASRIRLSSRCRNAAIENRASACTRAAADIRTRSVGSCSLDTLAAKSSTVAHRNPVSAVTCSKNPPRASTIGMHPARMHSAAVRPNDSVSVGW